MVCSKTALLLTGTDLLETFWTTTFQNDGSAWPARSPDLTACDYWLWGHLKQLVYRRQPDSLEELKISIRAAFAEVTNDVRQRAIAEFDRHVRLCAEKNDNHIE